MSMFKAYDIRKENLFPEEIYDLGLTSISVLEFLKKPHETATSGYDARISSPKLHEALVNSLRRKCKVFNLGLVPVPIVYFDTKEGKRDFGAYVTASHLPARYNGLKLIRKDGTSFFQELEIMKYFYENKKFVECVGEKEIVYVEDTIERYIEFHKSHIKLDKDVSVVVDAGNGAASKDAPKILEEFGFQVHRLYCEFNGTFPNRSPEPTEESLNVLREEVIKKKANFGVGFDGDGDRSVFVDEKGRVLDGSTAIQIFAKYILEQRKGKVVASLDCSSSLKNFVEENDGKLIWSKVGHTNIEDALVKEEALFAGELSNHFYFNMYGAPYSDGILSTAIMGEIVSRESLSSVVNALSRGFLIKDKFECEEGRKSEIMERIVEKLGKYNSVILDGIKVFLEDGQSILVRPSNTEPLIRVTVEAPSREECEKIYKKFSKIVAESIR